MRLYDELYIGIPSGIRIEGCVIGEKWTKVLANGNIGIAKTIEMPENAQELAASFVGKFLRDAAGHLYWPTLAHASVGVAAMNAWYNTRDRAEALSPAADAPEIENVKVISADTLITRELPKLLEEAGEGANIVLEGESLPCSALFFATDYPIRELRGCYAKSPESAEDMVPFAARPQCIPKIHETEWAADIAKSNYKASKFNNSFNGAF